MPVPMIRGRSSRVRRSREYNLPFAVDNRLALDAAVGSSVTTSIDGVTQWSDLGPTGNVFTNDHAAGSQPGYGGGLITFDGGDHLHRPGGLIPATGHFVWACRATPTSVSGTRMLFTQYLVGVSGRLLFGIQSGIYIVNIANVAIINGPTAVADIPVTVVVRRSGPTVWTFRVNGSAGAVQSTFSSGIAQTGNTIGSHSTSSVDYDGTQAGFWHGSIERIGIWHGTFNNDDLAEIEDWTSNGG